MKRLFATITIVLMLFFSASAAHALNIVFGWDTHSDKADIAGGGFKLLISQASGGPFVTCATITDVNAVTYTFVAFETVYPGSKYYFVLRAFRKDGLESVNSNEVVWNKPTTTTTSIIPTTTTTSSIKPVAPVTGLSVTTVTTP